MIVGNYTLNLYCRNRGKPGHAYQAHPVEFIAEEHGSEARRLARQDGWRLDLRTNEATCPDCVKAGR